MTSRIVSAAWHAGMNRPGEAEGLFVAYGPPANVLLTYELAQIPGLIEQAHMLAVDGFHVVGGLAYEAAPAFDPSLKVCPSANLPLAEFHVFKPSQVEKLALADLQHLAEGTDFHAWTDSLSLSAFRSAFQKIRQAILEGEFYQVNFTTRLHARASNIDPWHFFQHLYLAQPAQQSLFLRGSCFSLLSLSPELFFEWDGQVLNTAPMKGTRQPGQGGYDLLSDSEKDRAENVMIVDLLRNDIAKVCEPRSVQVRSLFDVMHLPTVDQMTSSISGRTSPGTRLSDVFKALFPCGSVTGAPKSQAMLRISEWETQPRKFYCGALGVLSPGGAAHFNVPIRTVIEQDGLLEYGVGSGITWYSTAEDEKKEWGQKTAFLRQATRDFKLLETLRLQQGSFVNLELHLARMASAADHFSYPFSPEEACSTLVEVAQGHREGTYRARCLLSAQGEFDVQLGPLPVDEAPVVVRLADAAMQAPPEFLLHKTTRRDEYEAFQVQARGALDVLLYSPDGLLTESCRFNLVLKVRGQFLTPKISEGTATYLLPGVMRSRLLMENTIQQSDLTLHDLKQAQEVWLVNSLRGWVKVGKVLGQKDEVMFMDKQQ
jgi:para-aminobenzoate synthetase / 4-amino-4-deoxychorismate lyase